MASLSNCHICVFLHVVVVVGGSVHAIKCITDQEDVGAKRNLYRSRKGIKFPSEVKASLFLGSVWVMKSFHCLSTSMSESWYHEILVSTS